MFRLLTIVEMKNVSRSLLVCLSALIPLAGRVAGDDQVSGTKLSGTGEAPAGEVKGFEIPKQAINSILVFRRDDGGQGTGFIVKREVAGKERFFVYTNQHVIAGCKTVPKALRADGSAVTLGKLVTAVNYDIAIFMLEGAEPNFLEIQKNVDQEISVGEPIGTPGNAGGASAITFKFGKVVAIGPELVEIDAMIKGGNSGGPILLRNGRVIGIVSYFKQETLDDARIADADKETVVRRFGYRVDNVKSWETPDWKRFVSQGERVSRVESTSKDLLQLVDSQFKSWNGNEQIGKIMGSFQRNVTSARSQKEVYGDLSKAFTELKQITLTDLNSAESDPSLYWWCKHTLKEQRDFRKRLDEEFEKQAAEARQKR
jgi:serine protease Do